MARLNFDFYDSRNDYAYTDGNIESELLQYAESNINNWYEDGRWPVVYHMSPLRHNILNWYPFIDNCTVLEIGAGCGALTGLLCERAAKVISVELTKTRAEINFARHSHFDNLEIVVADFQRIPDNWMFDYIIINGVLEYASYMINSEEPYHDFLRMSAKHLNTDGRILLAIENRLGLKYMSGAKEDHTGKFFSGINGYSNDEKIKTFSKQELSDLVSIAGLNILKFYYPYPDYKFPSEIFTDLSINNMKPSVANYPMDMSRVNLFNETHVYHTFMGLNIMQNFANSFLVEIASKTDLKPLDARYIKLSANRNDSYKIITIIDEQKQKVYKKNISPEGKRHLQHMREFSSYKLGNLQNIECMQEEDGLSYKYLSIESFEQKLLEQCQKNNLEGFLADFKAFLSAIPRSIQLNKQPNSDEFKKIFGSLQCERSLKWISNLNVDLIASNIFLEENIYHIIDYEWHLPCQIPIEFVIWRLLNQFIQDNNLDNFLNKELIYTLIQIDDKTENCFKEWEYNFAEKFVGIKNLHKLSKEILYLDIENAVQAQIKSRTLESSLFFDTGEGFTDKLYHHQIATLTGSGFMVSYSFEGIEGVSRLRWDPLEGYASCILVTSIETDASIHNILPLNAERFTEGAGYEFYSFDPQFEITGNFSKATFIQINFSCKIMDWTQGYYKREQELINIRQEHEDTLIKTRIFEEEKKQLIETSTNLMNQLKETGRNYEMLTSTLNQKSNEIENLHLEQRNLIDSIQSLQNQIDERNNFIEQHKIKAIINVIKYGDVYKGESNE